MVASVRQARASSRLKSMRLLHSLLLLKQDRQNNEVKGDGHGDIATFGQPDHLAVIALAIAGTEAASVWGSNER